MVRDHFRVVFGVVWFLAPQRPSEHPKKADEGVTAANRACIMRALADVFTINTQYGIEEGNCSA